MAARHQSRAEAIVPFVLFYAAGEAVLGVATAVFVDHANDAPPDSQAAAAEVEAFWNDSDRPHRSLSQRPPSGARAHLPDDPGLVAKSTRCNGLINEYRNAA